MTSALVKMPAVENMAGNIYLIGLPGSGKTTLGKILARKLQRKFIDADHYLIEKSGVDIPTIFELEGEAGFRIREKAIIKELVKEKNCVLATGGGAVISESNREQLKNNGYIIYLHSTPETLYSRVSTDKNRPLLQKENPLLVLNELYQQRDSLYRSIANLTISIESDQFNHILTFLIKQLPPLLLTT